MPPPSERGETLRIDVVRNVALMTLEPLTITVASTAMSGVTAMRNVA